MTADAIINLIFRAKNESEKEVKRVKQSLEEVKAKAEALQKRGKQIATAGGALTAGVTAPLALFGKSAVETAKRAQALEMSLKAITGSSEGAARELNYLESFSKKLGVNFEATADSYKSLLAATTPLGMSTEETRKVFESIVKSGRALGLTNDQLQGSLTAVQQMFSKGTVSAEELRGQLGERLPGAFSLAAKSIGVTEQQLGKMLEQGELLASDLLPKLADLLVEKYGSAAEEAADSAAAAEERRRNQFYQSQKVLGEGLLPIHTKFNNALAKMLDWFNNLAPDWQKFITYAGLALAVIGPLVTVVGGMVFAFGALLPVLTTVGGAIAAIGFGPMLLIVAGLVAQGTLLVANWQRIQAGAVALANVAVAAFQRWRANNSETIASLLASFTSLKESLTIIATVLFSWAQQVGATLDSLLEPIGGLDAVWKLLFDNISLGLDLVFAVLGTLLEIVSNNFKAIADVLSGQKTVWEAFKDTVGANLQAVLELVRTIVVRIVQPFRDLRPQLLQAGKDMMQGLLNGMKAKGEEAVNFVGGLANRVKGAFTNPLGIFSPSRVFRDFGRWLMEGLGLGIDDKAEVAVKATLAAGERIKNAAGAVTLGAGLLASPVAGATPTVDVSARQNPIVQQANQIADAMRVSNVAAGALQGTFSGLEASITGLLDGTMTWEGALQNVAGSISGELISSFAKMAAAWITQQFAMSAVAATTNAANAASAAPAATLASIGSFGQAAIIGSAAVLAALAAVSGFESGGYTGDVGTSEVAGFVHGREFVMNAAATAANRPLLEKLNSGGQVDTASAAVAGGGGGSQEVNVIIVDSTAKAQRMSSEMAGEVRIVARQEIERRRG